MYTAIIVAAGKGTRTGLSTNKVLTKVHGSTILEYSVKAFQKDPLCEAVFLVYKQDDLEVFQSLFNDSVDYVLGGNTREDSVYNALIKVKTPYVLVHDGARPYLEDSILKKITHALKRYDAITLALPVTDTVKRVSFGKITEEISRENLVRIQTPQAFKTDILQKAYHNKHHVYTCDATRVRKELNHDVYTVLGSPLNIKFTTLEDLKLLELILHDTHRT
ncbi:MAG: 2-C-methyl-D-erythritol 4-phosphate cytidylyltransferase [Candidatus Izemoplasmataceae bacterium]